MLRQVVDLFGIEVTEELSVMRSNQSLAGLTARLVESVDAVLEKLQPDFALVQGDTATVLCASLACFYRKIPVGHVEAGLRTGNIWSPFPEEANRRLTSHLVTLHFAPTERARQNLLAEGVPGERILVTGNTVIDALQMEVARQEEPEIRAQVHAELAAELGEDWAKVPFVLVTGHRRENFGEGFAQICAALAELADAFPEHRFIYPVHLNPQVQEPVRATLGGRTNIKLVSPKDYRAFVALMKACKLVLTDSGGVQEEAPGLGKPVLVMRDTTERPEGVEAGTVRLVGANARRIVESVTELLTDEAAYQSMAEAVNPYGDGKAAGRIVARIQQWFEEEHRSGSGAASS